VEQHLVATCAWAAQKGAAHKRQTEEDRCLKKVTGPDCQHICNKRRVFGYQHHACFGFSGDVCTQSHETHVSGRKSQADVDAVRIRQKILSAKSLRNATCLACTPRHAYRTLEKQIKEFGMFFRRCASEQQTIPFAFAAACQRFKCTLKLSTHQQHLHFVHSQVLSNHSFPIHWLAFTLPQHRPKILGATPPKCQTVDPNCQSTYACPEHLLLLCLIYRGLARY
jgi:hypothetical protein